MGDVPSMTSNSSLRIAEFTISREENCKFVSIDVSKRRSQTHCDILNVVHC